MKKFIFAVLFAAAFSGILSAQSGKKFSGWKKAETEHFNFIFEEGARQTTESYAEIADDAWNKIAEIYGFPQDKTNVYVTDRTNTVNAFTYFSPLEIVMFTTPCYISDFGFREEWKKLFFTHELIHVANVDFESKPKWPAKAFGSILGSFDIQNATPGWALEGLTTVLETELTNGGRGRSPFFELKYKAPTLDNAFISYNEIGLENEPPRGQAYVMGYLIMRSIADRYGVQALADIQRNKPYFGSFEEAVFKVTGESAENIYKDVKIALAKKYSRERTIPEGRIITPRTTGASYYKPAVILDDGSIVTLRTRPGRDPAVVKYNPSFVPGSNYAEDSMPEKNLNTVMQETILLENSFPDEYSVTADKNETVYAVLSSLRNDRMPGFENETPVFKWTKEKGLKQLTKGTSYFWPRVSRDGSVLVALKQSGLNFVLVQLDTETGKETELLSIPDSDILEPSLNDDGTKIAFLIADGKRAAVCQADLDSIRNYKVVVNGTGEIIDPIFPSWNSDGKLLYSANTRGRLEVFEYSETEGTSAAVVSDPVGALWAYKSEKGIYYYSYTSNGYSVKMKPLSEWGAVPDFAGPSLPGEKICFGNLENDYPEFNPYPSVQERVVVKESNDKKEKEGLFKKNEKNNEPIPVSKIELKGREQKFTDQLKNLKPVETSLKNEKKYIPLPEPVLYIPIFSFMNSDDTVWGLGYDVVWLNPKLQNTMGLGDLTVSYYPEKNNFDFFMADTIPVGPSEIDIIVSREISEKVRTDSESGAAEKISGEENSVLVAVTVPLFNRQQYKTGTGVYFSILENGILFRQDNKPLPVFSGPGYDYALITKAGLSFNMIRPLRKDRTMEFSANVSGLLPFMSDDRSFHLGADGKLEFRMDTGFTGFSLSARGRYIRMPEDASIAFTDFKYGGEKVDTSEPGRFLFAGNLLMPFANLPYTNMFLGCEKLVSYTKESTILFDENAILKLGLEMRLSPMNLEMGVSCKTDFESGLDFSTARFYCNFSYGCIQF